jgi:hypothetical protein
MNSEFTKVETQSFQKNGTVTAFEMVADKFRLNSPRSWTQGDSSGF